MGRQWLEDINGALFRISEITSVTPLPIKGDRSDQTKVTAVHTALTTTGGHTHTTTLPFDKVVGFMKAQLGELAQTAAQDPAPSTATAAPAADSAAAKQFENL